MKNRLLLLIFSFLAANFVNAQKCGTYYGSYHDQEQKFPAFYQSLEGINSDLEANYKSVLAKMNNLKMENGKRIIPVVVHVIHNLGNENISDSKIQEAIDALNKNINGQSDKFLNKISGNPLTPDIFASVRGVANLEFRLAKIDPNGNSTNGILRVQSELTNQPENRNSIKGLSYWNSYQYLNIWTLLRFAPQDDGGTLLGFAQFPFGGGMSTDGVALIASGMSDPDNTTLTHEVGHWLGLRHIWGDAECGDDGVKDTPPQRFSNGFGDNTGILPTPAGFPYHVGVSLPASINDGCVADSLNPAGEMFMNYMDYTNDNYVTMFSAGQVNVMNETLDGIYESGTGSTSIGFREYMWSAENIALTGVADGFVNPTCIQTPDFVANTGMQMCLGENIVLKGNKTQFLAGTVRSMLWDYGDGNSDASNANTVSHTYSSVGSYDVSLTIEYNEELESRAYSLSDLDLENATSYDSILETLNVQGTKEELLAMNASNISLHLDLDSLSILSTWKRKVPLDSILGAHSSIGYGLDTFLLTFSVNYGDSLKIEEYDRLALCFSVWQKDSIQFTGETKTYYYGNYESDSFDAYFMDTLFHRGEVEKKTYVAYYSNSCLSTTLKENFIIISPSSSLNSEGSYTYDFEDVLELTGDWQINKVSNQEIWDFNAIENSSWELINGVAVSGSTGLMINKDNLTLGTDELISVAYDLSDLTSPAIKFSYSGASSNTFPVNEVNVYYSDDCGEIWRVLGSLSNLEVANAGLYTNNFKPTKDEWINILMTDNQLKNNNIKFKFEYVTNGNANNFYLDNIRIGEAENLMMPSVLSSSRVSIYPNPTVGKTFIEINGLANKVIDVILVNILGSEIKNLYNGEIDHDYYVINDIDLSNIETGIYFINVVADGELIMTNKLILK